MTKLKKFLKSIPVLGWLLRWAYNILRINNTKHRLLMLENRLNKLVIEHQKLSTKFKQQEQFAYDLVRKHITSQLIYFHQKIDAAIQNSDHKQLTSLKDNIDQNLLDEYYLHFENKFRGTREEVLENCKEYLKFLPDIQASKCKSLDIGCGRGEWVELMQDKGYEAYGIDLNPYILEVGKLHKIKNLQVIDAFEYFKQTPDNSFDLITAFHIIEHIPFENLVHFLLEIKRIAKPDATIFLETPNPKNPQVSSYYFYIDSTHLNPIPHQSIEFLLEYLGFKDIQIKFLHPIPDIVSHKEAAQDYLIIAKNDYSLDKSIPSFLKKRSEKQTIFIDKSALRFHDGNSGIQRVVKKQIQYLQKLYGDMYNIEPVYLKQLINKSVEYYYDKLDFPVSLKKGDILYIPDLSYNSINKAVEFGLYEYYKKLDIKIVFLVHDILPITHESFFKHKNAKQIHHRYIMNISKYANLIISTTEVGKTDIIDYINSQGEESPKIETLHLGSDITVNKSISTKINNLSNTQTNFLMVGTIEPRKAHKQVIEAFDILWKDKTSNIKLIPTLTIIGKQGWLVEDTITMIKQHPLLNKNLFYIEKASDEELQTHYLSANAVIIASYAEGFGLPLVEAIHYKKPIIARDIKVFREIADTYPRYFKDTNDPADIASVIKSYINEIKTKEINTKKQSINYLTWKQHTKKLLNILNKL